MADFIQRRTGPIALAVAAILVILGLSFSDNADARARYLGKWEARLAAESEALDLALKYSWASDWGIGSCSRWSRNKINCRGTISGEEFDYCSSYSFRCYFTEHSCTFGVLTHTAGYSTLGRVRNLRCSSHRTSI